MSEEITGADTLAPTAEEASEVAEETEAPETVEADTQDDPAEGDDSEGEGGEEKPDKGKHQTTLEERAEQIAAKKMAELEAKIMAELEAKYKPKETQAYVPLDDSAWERINLKRAELEDSITEFRMEGTEEGFRKAYQARKQLENLETAIIENIAAREKYEAEQKQQQYVSQQAARVSESAEFYRRANNIPQDIWQAGEQKATEMLQADPVLMRKWGERASVSPTDAIDWLYGLVKQEMASKQQVSKQKEVAKSKQVVGSTASQATAKADDIRPGMDIKEFVRIRNEQERKRIYG